ncbi:hypothetical protein EH220_06630 [bacterium]|nr:MAG: hypothetical protein EH220_06630 [bacterium]
MTTLGRTIHPAGLVAAYVMVSIAQVISYGRFDHNALILVTLGIGSGLWAIMMPHESDKQLQDNVLVLCVVATLLAALIHNPLTYQQGGVWVPVYRIGCVFCAAIVLTYLVPAALPKSVLRMRFLLLMAFAIGVRLAIPLASPTPGEDVWVVQQEAASALLAGRDPYVEPYSQIFAPQVYELFGYRSGFHYPPLSLVPIVPAFLFWGDIRWSFILCDIFLISALWLLLRRNPKPFPGYLRELIVLLWALNPSILFVLEHSWTEPFGLALLAAFALLSVRFKVWSAAVALALFFSFKQYTVLLFPLLLFAPFAGYAFVLFLALNAVMYAPWLFIGMQGVADSLLEPWRARPRPDGLSLSALWMNLTQRPSPSWFSALCLWSGMWIALRRLQGGSRGLLSGIFIVLALLFISAKQSFCNYYYFLSYILLLILALPPDREATQ